MIIQENIPLAPKTTMKIGGQARYFAELAKKEDVEEAFHFAGRKEIPLIVLGAGANTIFADGVIEALVVTVAANKISFEDNTVRAEAGTYLATLVNEAAEHNLDLSPLTGIPGTVGGALFGNAGQGFGGVWTGHFVASVEAFVDGAWKTFTKEECAFGYRMSVFKQLVRHAERSEPEAERRANEVEARHEENRSVTKFITTPILWSCVMNLPSRPQKEINAEINRLLKRRSEAQPFRKTAGSCFLSVNKEEPAWKMIDAAGLRGCRIGGIAVSEKHANFLINEKDATFEDAVQLVQKIQSAVPKKLQVEMRFIEQSGRTVF